jgi:protein involved in polysaccharide export with SLBB domain
LAWIGPSAPAPAAELTEADQARIRELMAAEGGEAALAFREEGLRAGAAADPFAGGADIEAAGALPDSVEWERIETAPAEVEEPSSGPEVDPVPFGYSLFENSPESYRQPAFGPVDPEYPLGPGDEIVLDVWGDTVFRVERTLDREGGVNLPDAGRVVLAGMTLEEVRRTLRRSLSRVYSGLAEDDETATTHLAVTLGNLRVIRVFVVGRARRPGGYDLSAASTVFHGLFFAGGPAANGSMRDIRLVRGGGEVATLDVYEYLRTGRRDGDVRLENDDTIFIGPTGPRVTIRGEVKEPGVYEMKTGETLGDLLETAAGLTELAFRGRVQIERIVGGAGDGAAEDRRLLDFALEDSKTQALEDGDVVTVFGIQDRMRNFVTIRGEVRRPGTYELREGEKLSELVREAGGLLETAFLERAQIIRTYDDERREQLAVDLRRVLGGDVKSDPWLEARDEITVHSIRTFEDDAQVSIYGAVRSPGSYELRENMTLQDLILLAGGLHESAFADSVEISRIDPDEAELRTAEILRVPLGEDYLSCENGDLPLEPWDNIFVRESPYYELQRNVRVAGEVRFPGVYSLTRPTETLAEVIGRAGGLKDAAFPEGFQLFRSEGGLGRVALNLRKALSDPDSKDNVILFVGDSLHVPQEPKTVTVKGEVGYPTSLVYDSGWSIGDYIAHAGGTTDKADEGQVRVVYTTGAAARVKKFWFDPDVLPGSTIVVPTKEQNDVDWGDVIRDTTSILASLATVALVVNQIDN